MVEINANIRLRPIRIGFLVRPNDFASVQEVMRYCAAVWGGGYNPIIPVFSKLPKSWASDPFDRVRGIGVAKGYIRFFEPDVYVEAEKGLLELVGLGAVRDRLTVYPDVLTLSELLKPEKHKDWCVPAFGLNIQDVQAHLYRTDQQFTKRDQHENIIVEAERGSGIAELIFGVFPDAKIGWLHSAGLQRRLSANEAERLSCVMNADHLRRILAKYAIYYNEVRTHVSLGKDAPCTRPIERFGEVVAHPILGGLHHRYARI
jgi:hypothetical protein